MVCVCYQVNPGLDAMLLHCEEGVENAITLRNNLQCMLTEGAEVYTS